jgi:hypothetical protein
MHDNNANTCASYVTLVVIIQLAYVISFQTGLRHLELTKTGCDGGKQVHFDKLASTCLPVIKNRNAQ